MQADRSLHMNRSQTRLVEEQSPEAGWLLAAKGHEIPADMVKRLGLVEHDGRVVQACDVPAPEPEPEPEIVPEPEPEAVADPEPIMPPESKRSRRKK